MYMEEQIHNLKMLDFDKSEEIRELLLKIDKMNDEIKYIKESAELKLQNTIQRIEKPLKSRVVSLEYDLRIQKDKVNSAKQQYELSKKNDEIFTIMDKLSVMFLTKSQDPNFLTSEQQKLIKSLFGDYGSRTYKEKIRKLELKYNKLLASKSKNYSDFLKLITSNLHYLNILLDQDKYKCSDKFLRDKIHLLEMKASITEDSSKHSAINECSEESNLFSDEEVKNRTLVSHKSPLKPELNVSEINHSLDINNFLGSECDDLEILSHKNKFNFAGLSNNDSNW